MGRPDGACRRSDSVIRAIDRMPTSRRIVRHCWAWPWHTLRNAVRVRADRTEPQAAHACSGSASPVKGLRIGVEKTVSATASRQLGAVEPPPLALDQALVRQEARLVGEMPAVGDVEAQIEVAESPGAAGLDLLEDAVGAQADARRTRGRRRSRRPRAPRCPGRQPRPPPALPSTGRRTRPCRSRSRPGTRGRRRRRPRGSPRRRSGPARTCAGRRGRRAPRRRPPGRSGRVRRASPLARTRRSEAVGVNAWTSMRIASQALQVGQLGR